LDEVKHNTENIRGLNMEAVKATFKLVKVKHELLYEYNIRNDRGQVYAAYCA
jgi:hypothetical protein